MNYIKYLATYIVANAHQYWYKSWHKNSGEHVIYLQYENFEVKAVGCTCGVNFWRSNARSYSGQLQTVSTRDHNAA